MILDTKNYLMTNFSKTFLHEDIDFEEQVSPALSMPFNQKLWRLLPEVLEVVNIKDLCTSGVRVTQTFPTLHCTHEASRALWILFISCL